MKQVLLRAPLLTVSGYGVHSRQIFEWLESRNDVDLYVEIVSWGVTSWMINPDYENGLIGRIMSKSKKTDKKFDISIQVQLPDEWDPNLAKRNIGVSAVVETDRCNPEWLKKMDTMDLVIVPTTFLKDTTIKNTGKTKTKIVVVPEWYNENIDRDLPPLDFKVNTPFNFLTIGQITGGDPYSDRKNIFFLVKWFCETFNDDPNIGLIIKTNHGKGTKIDKGITQNTFNNIINEVRKGPFPRIHLLHGNLTSEEISRIYKRKDIKAFMTLTRGEGYGLPLVEAAASGIPVIATNWSGHLDFMKYGEFIPIDYSLKEIPSNRADGRIFLTGFKWANASEHDFKMKIKNFRNSYSTQESSSGDLSSQIKARFSKSAIMKKYDSVFNSFCRK